MPGSSQQSHRRTPARPGGGPRQRPILRSRAPVAARPQSLHPAASVLADDCDSMGASPIRTFHTADLGTGRRVVRLAPSANGWSLLTTGGQPVFEASGADARRRCLVQARAEGVLAVLG